MAKIARKTQKVFGGSASSNQVAKFGSLAAGSPVRYDGTADPDDIQSLSQYDDGWHNAILGGNSPAIEDRNALDLLFSRQIAYLMQAGIPEYDASTEYHTGSMVNAINGKVYMSIADTNTGNALSDDTKWRQVLGNRTGEGMIWFGFTESLICLLVTLCGKCAIDM